MAHNRPTSPAPAGTNLLRGASPRRLLPLGHAARGGARVPSEITFLYPSSSGASRPGASGSIAFIADRLHAAWRAGRTMTCSCRQTVDPCALQIDRVLVAEIVDSGSVIPVEGTLRRRVPAHPARSVAQPRDGGARSLVAQPRRGRRLPQAAGGFSIWSAVRGLIASGMRLPQSKAAPDKAQLDARRRRRRLRQPEPRALAGSRLVDVTFGHLNPARAQKIATSFAEAFIAANLDKAVRGHLRRQDVPGGPDQAGRSRVSRRPSASWSCPRRSRSSPSTSSPRSRTIIWQRQYCARRPGRRAHQERATLEAGGTAERHQSPQIL